LDCDVHSGTHVDAPLHFLSNGGPVEAISLDVLIGPALVAYLPHISRVTAADLEALDLTADVRRLLIRTSNSDLWTAKVREFQRDFVALTTDAAAWVVERDIRLLGVDYLSVQRFGDGPEVHQILLGAAVAVVEGLSLAGAEPGGYELTCLPLRLVGAEGAPARAVLRKQNSKDVQCRHRT